jgi:hypothetical protein
MNEMTVLKIVDRASMPRASRLSGISGCSDSTTKPNAKSAALKTSSAMVYCFQSCAPLSSFDSNQCNTRGAR